MSSRAPLIILSGPSGVGKSVVIARLLAAESPRLRLSVSATTRQKRDREVDGQSYHFWTRGRFEQGLRDGEFLEYAEVFGNYYGSLKREVEPFLEQGIGVVLDVDVQGAAQVRRQCPEAVSIFLRPPSLEVLEQRLRARGTESEAAIQRRLQGARQELERAGEYDYQVINDDLETAVADVRAIILRHFERESHAG